ncbi:hypothetical protein PV05_00218 [Exophiala xenobiotica]|uniref:Sodium:neurotransmitter symporter family protein n=1 Tax=Exophiala xenobiotica TaxID=348802 RepID=A0A0D2C4Z5_9EURO|nr:uncharacterized protein PV05_00218 [Exophiala xenobiotica]KIW59961.1 hypothetical protein PV05_00218 [Exophiala xenobiotica]
MNALKKLGSWLAPPPQKADDGRDQWPSRMSFILASCGGAIGMGNLLRYPSQVYNNLGLQWFVPYLMSIVLLAIPALALEIAAGNAYRGGTVVAYNNISSRMKGTGLALNYVGFVVVTYFVPILCWIMVYFRASFQSPLPWTGRGQEFYMRDAVGAVDPVPGSFTDSGAVESYTSYPGTSLIGELVGWDVFTWFVIWLCMFRGVGLTGRVVYFTMGLPVIMTIILIGRSVSLENAGAGIKLYFATWYGSKLADGKIWQDAVGQVFFSTGVGFGYYTAYASYNARFSNAAQDAVIIVCSNCLFEAIAAFAVFGIVGFLRLWPSETGQIGSFSVGFVTYPEAITQMPGANFWAVLFFFTLMLLGVSSSFAMLDAVVTLVMDSELGRKVSRPIVATTLVVLSFLLSLPYCTEFGYYYLDGVDRYINNVALVFVVWAECVAATTVYRYKDAVGQVGFTSFLVYNIGYFSAQVAGVAVGHSVRPAAGAGVGFGLFIAGLIVSLTLAKTPDSLGAPSFWQKSMLLKKVYYLAFYSGNQLRCDLNLIIGLGKNWKLPFFWAPLLRYVTGPVLAIVFSFAYPGFQTVKNDPMYIFGFIVAHFLLLCIALGFIVPKWFDVFIPRERRIEGELPSAPDVTRGSTEAESDHAMESGEGAPSGEKIEEPGAKAT